jgi:biopolymer transport protein ExbB
MLEMFSSLHAGGLVSAQAVTGGIWKALFTTVAGLSVAIPLILVHGALIGRVNRQEEELERGCDFITREKLLASARKSV